VGQRVEHDVDAENNGAGAPENAKWIQFTAALRNPYMGREMLNCGVEVK